MNRFKIILIGTCFIFGFSAAVFSVVNMQEGNWEITIQTDMPGMPFKMPAVKSTKCMTKDDMNPQENKNQKCKIISQKTVGNTYSWVQECPDKKGAVRSEGSITYKGTTFNGTVKINSNGTIMKQVMTGRRLGPCSK